MQSPLNNNKWLLFAVNEFGVPYYTASPRRQLTETKHVMMLVRCLENELIIQGTDFDHLSALWILGALSPALPTPIQYIPIYPLANRKKKMFGILYLPTGLNTRITNSVLEI